MNETRIVIGIPARGGHCGQCPHKKIIRWYSRRAARCRLFNAELRHDPLFVADFIRCSQCFAAEEGASQLALPL